MGNMAEDKDTTHSSSSNHRCFHDDNPASPKKKKLKLILKLRKPLLTTIPTSQTPPLSAKNQPLVPLSNPGPPVVAGSQALLAPQSGPAVAFTVPQSKNQIHKPVAAPTIRSPAKPVSGLAPKGSGTFGSVSVVNGSVGLPSSLGSSAAAASSPTVPSGSVTRKVPVPNPVGAKPDVGNEKPRLGSEERQIDSAGSSPSKKRKLREVVKVVKTDALGANRIENAKICQPNPPQQPVLQQEQKIQKEKESTCRAPSQQAAASLSPDPKTSAGLSPDPKTSASPPLTEILESILEKLQKKDTYGVFSEPVDPAEVPDYYDIIKNPMDFSTIKKKLSKGSYARFESFERDVMLICSNAMRYNGPKTVYYKQAKAIQDVARRAFSSLRGGATAIFVDNDRKVVSKNNNSSKRTWRKSAMNKRMYDGVRMDLSSGTTLASGGDDRVDSQDMDEYDEEGISYKSFKDGRRPLSPDENRRVTYIHPIVDLSDGLQPLHDLEGLHLVPIGPNVPDAYARSLAYFGSNLGPVAWKHVERKIRMILAPNVSFGPGWLGEQEAPVKTMAAELRTSSETPHSGRLVVENKEQPHVEVSYNGHTVVGAMPTLQTGNMYVQKCGLGNKTGFPALAESFSSATNDLQRMSESLARAQVQGTNNQLMSQAPATNQPIWSSSLQQTAQAANQPLWNSSLQQPVPAANQPVWNSNLQQPAPSANQPIRNPSLQQPAAGANQPIWNQPTPAINQPVRNSNLQQPAPPANQPIRNSSIQPQAPPANQPIRNSSLQPQAPPANQLIRSSSLQQQVLVSSQPIWNSSQQPGLPFQTHAKSIHVDMAVQNKPLQRESGPVNIFEGGKNGLTCGKEVHFLESNRPDTTYRGQGMQLQFAGNQGLQAKQVSQPMKYANGSRIEAVSLNSNMSRMNGFPSQAQDAAADANEQAIGLLQHGLPNIPHQERSGYMHMEMGNNNQSSHSNTSKSFFETSTAVEPMLRTSHVQEHEMNGEGNAEQPLGVSFSQSLFHTWKSVSSQRLMQRVSSSLGTLPPDLNVRLQSPVASPPRVSRMVDSQQPDLALQL